MKVAYDVFISHASEDKGSFVRPLVAWLTQFGLKVWYDEHELKAGDSLSRSIDRGLVESRYGVVVISPAFLEKAWPEYEYRSLVGREVGRDKVIIPVWHNISRDEVSNYSPWLADKLAVTDKDLTAAALNILSVVDPAKYQDLYRTHLARQAAKSAPKYEVPPEMLALGTTIFHDHFPNTVIWRIRLTYEVFKEVMNQPLDDAIDLFRRDDNYENELHLWERMAAVYLHIKAKYDLDLDECQKLFSYLLDESAGKDVHDGAQPWVAEVHDEFNRKHRYDSGSVRDRDGSSHRAVNEY